MNNIKLYINKNYNCFVSTDLRNFGSLAASRFADTDHNLMSLASSQYFIAMLNNWELFKIFIDLLFLRRHNFLVCWMLVVE